MSNATVANKNSIFKELGFKNTITKKIEEIQKIYLEDEIPWIIGYSGGKDSTAVLQLLWMALAELPPEKRHKTIHVITTDTRVENPVVSGWVNYCLDNIREHAKEQNLPIEAHKLEPEVKDRFWVSMIGKGYPAPRLTFRWCTERMKINPANSFITKVTNQYGESIVVLGVRKSESVKRGQNITKNEGKYQAGGETREHLTRNSTVSNSMVYHPIVSWTDDDVWVFLKMHTRNPWGVKNSELLTMYQGATAGGECPLVVDSSTPSCGDSRFGCWVCTVVDKDKSMDAMIKNSREKRWMKRLVDFRNEFDHADPVLSKVKNPKTQEQKDKKKIQELAVENNNLRKEKLHKAIGISVKSIKERDYNLRDHRRLSGDISFYESKKDGLKKVVHGPYTQEVRRYWLRRLLEIQLWMQENGPENVANIELIAIEEMDEIRRIWVMEKHEIEDLVPQIYEGVYKQPYPGRPLDDALTFGPEEMNILKDVCGGDQEQYTMIRDLIEVERQYQHMSRRAGLFDKIERVFKSHLYSDDLEALNHQLKIDAKLEGSNDPDIENDRWYSNKINYDN